LPHFYAAFFIFDLRLFTTDLFNGGLVFSIIMSHHQLEFDEVITSFNSKKLNCYRYFTAGFKCGWKLKQHLPANGVLFNFFLQ
jgi:hypothetical protein